MEWKIAEEMVEQILSKVTQTEQSLADPTNSVKGNVVIYDDLAPVSDTAREEDKEIRLTILQKLLELACTMVIMPNN